MAFTCTECGYSTPKWLGRCPQCQAWGSFEETAGAQKSPVKTRVRAASAGVAKPITTIDSTTARARSTMISELDRVLGGGLVPGAVILLAGEPGVGKSTLLLDTAARIAAAGAKVLYVTGEESAGQVRLRAERIGALQDALLLAAETDLGSVLGMIEAEAPEFLVVDSVQTVASADVDGVPGGVTQVREVAAALIRTAKSHGIATILVGHITKDGTVAGPRLLEHLVDVVCSFEGEKHSRLRMLRAVKNRFGPTDEVGCFDMTEEGIVSLSDPSGLFLSRSKKNPPGTCLTVTMEGKRPLLIEIQALLTEASGPARRTVTGVESNRVAMILAVLSKTGVGGLRKGVQAQKRATVSDFDPREDGGGAGLVGAGAGAGGVKTSNHDVFVATVGGAKVMEPAADLAIAIALASAAADQHVFARLAAIGEISLSGEIRKVPGIGQRLSEASRLGISHAVVAQGALENVKVPPGMSVQQCETVAEAVALVVSKHLNR